METFVTVKTSFEGIHCFPEAPEEVKFLRQEHRHMFGVTAKVEVYSDDREIEFVMMKHRINDFLDRQKDECGVWQMGRTSCEQVAKKICDVLAKCYNLSGRYFEITVDEDGENGATISGVYEGRTEEPILQSSEGVVEKVVEATKLSLAHYQSLSYRAIQKHESGKEEAMHWAIGLGEEAGEVLSVIKHKYYGGTFDVMDLVGELGDVLWHVAALCTVHNIDLDDVAHYNLAKLDYRYPSKEFDDARSKARRTIDKSFENTTAYAAFKKSIKKRTEAGGRENEEV